MDTEYIEKCTSSWNVEQENGRVKLCSFFDRVDWETKYAIKVDGTVKSVIKKENMNHSDVFKVVCECI